MNHDDPQRRQALRALCEVAGRSAAGWDVGPGPHDAVARADAGAAPRRGRLVRAALTGAAGLLALAVVAAQLGGGTPPDDAPALAGAPRQAAPVPPPGPVAAAADVPVPVRWQGDELRVDLDQVPLQQAVGLLAGATGSVPTGVELLQTTAPVTMHMRFGDALSAWRHLLHDRARFAIDCGASGCRVRIDGEATAASDGSSGSDAAPRAAAARPGTDEVPAGKAHNATESQPDGSC